MQGLRMWHEPVPNIVQAEYAGLYALGTAKLVVALSLDFSARQSARGIVLNLTEADIVLEKQDYLALGDYCRRLTARRKRPIAILKWHQYGHALRYAEMMRRLGQPVLACLTLGESLAWIDYATRIPGNPSRDLRINQLHRFISGLSLEQLAALTAVAASLSGPRVSAPSIGLGRPTGLRGSDKSPSE
jgi:hypothetical protein